MNESVHISIGIHFDRRDSDLFLAVQYDMNEVEKMKAIQGVFVDGIEAFDPSFFRILEAEAVAMSLQQRIILLECPYVVF